MTIESSWRTAKTILVPTDGSEASLEALAVACDLAKRNKGKVYALYVIEVPRSLPLDAEIVSEAQKGEAILARAEKVADELDFEVESEIIQSREAGHAIVDEAESQRVDLIVMGVEAGSRGRFELGRSAQYVLKNALCEVWLRRRPAAEG